MKFGVFYNPMVPKRPGADDWEPGAEKRKFDEMIEQIEFADSLGFEYAFLGEHHFTAEYAHNSAPEVILGALARSTKNIRIGHGIVHASHNDPVRTAERIATIDLLSGGRVEFGFGSGGIPETAPFLGGNLELRAPRAHAFSRIAVDILASRGVYPGVDNEHYRLPAVNVVPKAVQTPHPPLWTSFVAPDQVDAIARQGLGALCLATAGAEQVAKIIEAYWAALKSVDAAPVGRGINPAVFTFGSGLIAPTDEEAQLRGREGMDYFGFGLTGGHGHVVANPQESLSQLFEDKRSGRADVREAMGVPEGFRRLGDAWSDMPGSFLCSPETARTKIRELEAAHIDGFLLNQQFGDTRHEHIMESLELFAREVMPEFVERRHLHEEWRQKQLADVQHPIVSSL